MKAAEYIQSLLNFLNLSDPGDLKHSAHPDLNVLIFSPHPDDEILLAPLALRLKKENQCKIINVAMTLGSDEKRRLDRKKELIDSCQTLGYQIEYLENSSVLELLEKYKPFLIILPHSHDQHTTHQKVFHQVWNALGNKNLLVAMAEYWLPNLVPNALIELSVSDVELSILALEKHSGEIKRNPYHLRLPSYLVDNVRRGQELVGDRKENSIPMVFGQLYELGILNNGLFKPFKKKMFYKKDDLVAALKQLS